ncbi:hypothetical protein C8J57DRAFT_138292 [Mycena rebaudengoi]|nr:hypothetical protein C8J57DRAFT_138292 [Mycena rebaudengoi]
MSICRNCGSQELEPLSPTLHEGHLSTRERRSALTKVRAQILLHQKFLDALKEEEAELKASLSPVGYLPVEITSCIFLHCLPSHGRVIPSPSRAPLLLAKICHHWREVALSTGELWSCLYPPRSFIRAQARHDWHPLRALIQTWFCRAKAAPLSLGLNCNFARVSPALLELISSFAGQIECLDFHFGLHHQFQYHRPFQTRYPLLQRLATDAPEAEIGDFLKDTPSLRELCLGDKNWTSFNFPLPLLNRLQISAEISITTFLDMLNNFPVLSRFKYNLREPDTNGVDGSMALVFPHLSSLAGSTTALCFITLPGLRELELEPELEPHSSEEPDYVRQFLARSSCTVDRFTLSFKGYVDELRIWLTVFPSLSVLHIKDCDRLVIVLDCLDSESLAPRLSEITIDFTINFDNDYDDTLVALLRRRTNPRRSFKLRKFHMLCSLYRGGDADHESHVWTPGDLAESALNDMIADGLDFLLRIESNGVGTRTWPPAYIDPLPFFPLQW